MSARGREISVADGVGYAGVGTVLVGWFSLATE